MVVVVVVGRVVVGVVVVVVGRVVVVNFVVNSVVNFAVFSCCTAIN